MIGMVPPFQAVVAAQVATPAPMRQFGALAIEPVARAEGTSARGSDRRNGASGLGDEAPARQARDALARPPRRLAATARTDRALARPSAAFIAQAIAQAMGEDAATGEPALAAQPFHSGHPGRLAYRLAAERDTTYTGFIGPVDFLI